MRYRFHTDHSLLSLIPEQRPGVGREVLRRFGSRLALTADSILSLPESERNLLLAAFVNSLHTLVPGQMTSLMPAGLQVSSLLSALLLDFWPVHAKACQFNIQAIHAGLQKKQPEFLVSGLNHLASGLRTLSRLPDDVGIFLRVKYAPVAALRPRDLAALTDKHDAPLALLTRLDSLHPLRDEPSPGLLAGLIAVLRLEHLKHLVTEEDREHTLNFSLLERFADCEHVRKRFFSKPLPDPAPVLSEESIDSLRLKKRSLPEEPASAGADSEAVYFNRYDVLLASERLLRLAIPKDRHCFGQLEILLARHGTGDGAALVSHAMRCERCSAYLSVSPLLEGGRERRLSGQTQRRMRSALSEQERVVTSSL